MRILKSFRVFVSLLSTLAVLAIPVGIAGCSGGCSTSQQRKTVNTLFTVGETVDASYRSYLDLVVAGKVATNSVPQVSQAYSTFQLAFNAATVLAANSTNAVAPQSLMDAAAGVTAAINNAKKGN